MHQYRLSDPTPHRTDSSPLDDAPLVGFARKVALSPSVETPRLRKRSGGACQGCRNTPAQRHLPEHDFAVDFAVDICGRGRVHPTARPRPARHARLPV